MAPRGTPQHTTINNSITCTHKGTGYTHGHTRARTHTRTHACTHTHRHLTYKQPYSLLLIITQNMTHTHSDKHTTIHNQPKQLLSNDIGQTFFQAFLINTQLQTQVFTHTIAYKVNIRQLQRNKDVFASTQGQGRRPH